MEGRRGQPVSLPALDSSGLNDWLGARFRNVQEQQPGFPTFPGLPGLPPQSNAGLLGLGYLDAGLPAPGLQRAIPQSPYPSFNTSATERQLADLFPSQQDLLNVPGLAQLDPFLGNLQEEPLFGTSGDGQQNGEDKPRSKMQEKNRRAQRRFRERQKTKFTELTGKVEELEGRLGELLSEKARLEDRTSILEQTLELRRGSSLDLDAEAAAAARRLDSVEVAELQQGGCASPTGASAATGAALSSRGGSLISSRGGSLPLSAASGASDDLAEGSLRFFQDDLRLSLPINGQHSISPQALRNTSAQDMTCIYEQYADELRAGLKAEGADQPLTPAAVRVVKLANEISTLLLRAWALNPVTMRKLHQHLHAANAEHAPEELHRIAGALRLTEEQRAKLVAVTGRYQAQRGMLVAQRQGIYVRLQQRPLEQQQGDGGGGAGGSAISSSEECVCEFLRVHDAMSMLKMNLRQEHWETLSYGSTCTQLFTPWQMATLLVESHPLWYDFLTLAGVLAEGSS